MSGNETFSANSQNIKKFQLTQKAKSLLLIGIIVVPMVVGYFAYSAYQHATQDPNSSELAAQNTPAATGSISQSPTANPSTSQTVTNTPSVPSSTSSPATTTTPSTSTGSQGSQTSSSAVPQGVTVAMNSIEANGIKGNPYVSSSLDTSQVPSGTTVSFNRSTWTSYSKEVGAINATITAYGSAHSASVTFGVQNGTWKVTGYSISQ